MRRSAVVCLTLMMALYLGLASCSSGGGGGSSSGGGSPAAPVADAGADQSVSAGTIVTLDGSASTGATYAWSLLFKPAGSTAALDDPLAEKPAFTADFRGMYVLGLTVSGDGMTSETDYVVITARSWRGKELLEAEDYDLFAPRLAVDPSGNAVTIWEQSGVYQSMYANIYNAGTGTWKGYEFIDTGSPNSNYPCIVMDTGGNAFAIWASYNNIYANRYDAASGAWEGAGVIEALGTAPETIDTAIDQSGNGFVVWVVYDGSNYSVFADRYDADSDTWDGAVDIDAGDTNTWGARVAVNPDGTAFAIWQQYDGANYSIYANRFDAGSGTWEGAEKIDPSALDAGLPDIAVDQGGNAIAVWQQDDGTDYSIYANRYDAASGTWEGAGIIDAGSGNASDARIAFGPGGNAFAVWEQPFNTYNSIYANRYDAASNTWEGAGEIDAGNYDASNARIAFDPFGNAFAVWQQLNGSTSDIYANRYDAASGAWEGAEETDGGDANAYDAQIGFDSSGNAISVFRQFDGSHYSLYEVHFE